MIGSSRSYAIGWAHFQRAGGWKSLAAMLGVYLLLVFGALMLFYYMDATNGSHKGLTPTAITFLLVAQTVVLGLFGTGRVSSAVRLDLTSRMIESHRLMPVSNANAVLGYIFGPTTHTLAFFALNTILAYIFAAITGTNIWQVTLGQAVLLVFCIFLWSFAVVSTFVARYIMFIAIGVAIFGGCTMGIYAAFYFIPGLNILVAPFIGSTIYTFSGSSVMMPWTYFASFAAQGAFFVVFFSGACRRYRGLSPTTFSIPAVILLMAAWCGASLAGLFNNSGSAMFGRRGNEEHQVQVVVSIVTAMLLALLAMRTVVALQPTVKRFGWALSFLAGCFSIASIALIAVAADNTPVPLFNAILVLFVVAAAHVVTLYAIFHFLRRLPSWLAIVIAGFVCAMFWLTPLILEALIAMANTPSSRFAYTHEKPELGILGGFSAIGSILDVLIFTRPGPVLPGLIGQCMLALLLLTIALLVKHLRRIAAVAAPATTPLPVTAAAPSPASS